MNPKGPVSVVHLFGPERSRLLELLSSLSSEQYLLPTPCPGWTVKDITAHNLSDDLGNLSGVRDEYITDRFSPSNWEQLVGFINNQNELWVAALRRLSPRVLVELLAYNGERVQEYFSSLNPMSQGPNVAWAGSGAMPMWLHLAREYTERWVHQMQIRQAVGAPGLYERELFHPVLDTFVHALPVAFAQVTAPAGTHVVLNVTGEAGGSWSLVRETNGWALYEDVPREPAASCELEQDMIWRLWTKGISRDLAAAKFVIHGDAKYCEPILDAVAMIV
jgi:uncharacterized protein (TIGR03083 family)